MEDSIPTNERKEKFEAYENLVMKKLEKSLSTSETDYFSQTP